MKEKNEINAALTMSRIIWENVPQLRLSADSKVIIDELSKTLLENTQEQINKILAPMEVFAETFPKLIEKLPEDVKKDLKEEFSETRLKLESEFKTLREMTPTYKDTLNAIQTIADKINETAERKMEEIRRELANKFKEVLGKMGFPEPAQLKLLGQLIPVVIPLLEELLRFQKVPSEKGKQGELELIQQLQDYYPEDEYEYLGGSGDIDILAIPRFNGKNLDQKILIESKKNNSGWKRSFIRQVRTHMQLRGERFAILTVEVMPKSSNGFLFEHSSEGVVLITDRERFQITYGALRYALLALQPFRQREIDFRKLFTDKKINEAIEEAYHYSEWIKRIREKTQRIALNAKGVIEDVNQLDSHLKRSLKELQTRINNAVMQIAATEEKEAISTD